MKEIDKMEKMTKVEYLCDTMIMELREIKMHLCNGRDFEGGVALGGLINSMINLKDQEQVKREDCDDEEDDEEQVSEQYYKKICLQVSEELEEKREDIKDLIQENKEVEKKLSDALEILSGLFNSDHIYLDQRGRISEFLLRSGHYIYGVDARVVKKVM